MFIDNDESYLNFINLSRLILICWVMFELKKKKLKNYFKTLSFNPIQL